MSDFFFAARRGIEMIIDHHFIEGGGREMDGGRYTFADETGATYRQ
jgi:hypothetical protein